MYRSVQGLGWTGGFTVPGQEHRFSQQSCSGPGANPMDPGSDLICGRSAEIPYLERIGCRAVGFQGNHHCYTDEGNQGVFYCCPPGILDAELARAAAIPAPRDGQAASLIPAAATAAGAGIGVGIGTVMVTVGVLGVGGYFAWRWAKNRQEEMELEGY